MGKKILIAVGGTGGHLYPAQALARQLIRFDESNVIMFAGGGLGENNFFAQKEFHYQNVSSATFKKRHFLENIKAVGSISKGIVQSHSILSSFKPDIVVGFGSYHSLPLLAAARIKGIPIILHEANAIPGKVNRFFSKYAKLTGITFPQTGLLLPGKSLRVAFPLREGYTSSFASREEARQYFRLSPLKFTLLVFGGSQGALALNTQIGATILEMADRTKNFQVIHLTGNTMATNEVKKLYDDIGIESYVADFEEKVDKAWAAADMSITRAGASSIAEQIEMEVPGILVPFPYSADGHQDKNADYMVNEVQGAMKINEVDLNPGRLAKIIGDLAGDDRAELSRLRSNIRNYKQKNRCRDFCSVLCEVTGQKLR